MLFGDYPTERDERIERATIIVPLLAAAIVSVCLWLHSINFTDGVSAGVSIALILFAPAFVFIRTVSVRFTLAVLTALLMYSWPLAWFDVLDQLSSSFYTPFHLIAIGAPWWDTTFFKASTEAAFTAGFLACVWPARDVIVGVISGTFRLIFGLLTKYQDHA